jgi:1-acyl-sn-glycerol-3-phosphate acyltransferase
MLMMFPEGTRSRNGSLARAHPGSAMIALRTGALILPVAITGTEEIKWPRFFLRPRSIRRIRVVIGEPFTLSRSDRVRGDDVQAASDEMMRRIAALLPPEIAAYAELDRTTSPRPPPLTERRPKAGVRLSRRSRPPLLRRRLAELRAQEVHQVPDVFVA